MSEDGNEDKALEKPSEKPAWIGTLESWKLERARRWEAHRREAQKLDAFEYVILALEGDPQLEAAFDILYPNPADQ